MDYTVAFESFCIIVVIFSAKLTSLPRHLLVTVGTNLTKMLAHLCPDAISAKQGMEGKTVRLLSEIIENQNADSMSESCRKEKGDVPSLPRNQRFLEIPTDPGAPVYFKGGDSKELRMDFHKDGKNFGLELSRPTGYSKLMGPIKLGVETRRYKNATRF